MKRWIWRALLFLLLGAVVNVAVAWIAATCLVGKFTQRHGAITPPAWQCRVPDDWPVPDDAFEFSTPWSTDTHVSAEEVGSAGRGNGRLGLLTRLVKGKGDWRGCIADTHRFGWPSRSLQMSFLTDCRQNPTIKKGWSKHGCLILPAWAKSWANTHIPYDIEPLGFAANSTLYGVLTYALVFGPVLVRNRVRHCRRNCLHCAYPVGNSPVCTECGKPVKPRAAAAAIAEPRN